MTGKRAIGLMLLVALTLGGWGGVQPVRAQESLCVRPGGDEDCFASIQEAVDAAASGDIIVVKKGTYVEQVIINGKDLTLDAEDNATIQATTTMSQTLLPYWPDRSIVTIRNANVTVRDFVIDGLNSGETNQYLAGISYINAGGTIKKNTVKNIAFAGGPFFNPEAGYEGYAIQAGNFEAISRTLTVIQNTVTNFNNNGITVYSEPNPDDLTQISLDVTVSKNKIVGPGPTAVLDPYGIALGSVRGVVRDNQISNLSNPDFDPAGSAFGPAVALSLGFAEDLIVEDNRIRNSQLGIDLFQSTNTVIEDNAIRGPVDPRGFIGVSVSGRGTVIEDNDFRNFVYGIYLNNSEARGVAEDTSLEDNDFHRVATEVFTEPGASVAPGAAARANGHQGKSAHR